MPGVDACPGSFARSPPAPDLESAEYAAHAPSAIAKENYPKFLAPLGNTAAMSKQYRFTGKTDVGGKTYDIATFGSTNGFAYNKAVWKKAGVTE